MSSDPSLSFFGPVREFFGALGQKLAKGRIQRADPLDLGEESAENIQSFVVHDPIPLDAPVTQDTITQFLGWPLDAMEISMESKFNVSLNMTITKDDGTKFAEFPAHYFNLSLADVVELEEWATKNIMGGLVELGKQKLKDKMERARQITGK